MNQDKKTEREKALAENLKRERLNKIKSIITRIGLWVGVFAALAAMVWGLAKLGSQPVSVEVGTLSEGLGASDHIKGNPLSRLTLIEYSDFQCPACAQFYPIIKEAEQKYSKEMAVVYRHFPLPSHDKGDLAARASEAAAVQGKFWEMHDKLFETQTSWSRLSSSKAKELFAEYAVQFGLDKEKFLTDIESEPVKNRVSKDLDSGIASKISGTPTFFLNGNKLNIETYGDIDSAIADALAKNK